MAEVSFVFSKVLVYWPAGLYSSAGSQPGVPAPLSPAERTDALTPDVLLPSLHASAPGPAWRLSVPGPSNLKCHCCEYYCGWYDVFVFASIRFRFNYHWSYIPTIVCISTQYCVLFRISLHTSVSWELQSYVWAGWCHMSQQNKLKTVETTRVSPFSAFLVCSSNWYSFNIRSFFSRSICSFSLSMFSLSFLSFSTCSLQVRHSPQCRADTQIFFKLKRVGLPSSLSKYW